MQVGPVESDPGTANPLSAVCTAALVDASQARGAPFNQVTAAVAGACAEDRIDSGVVIDYVTAQGSQLG